MNSMPARTDRGPACSLQTDPIPDEHPVDRHMNRSMNRSTLAHAACASLFASSLAPIAQAAELFLLGLVPQAYADDCSEDGKVVVGYDPQSYWYWTRETGVVQLIGSTVPPGNSVGGSANISGDGRYMSVSTLQGKPLKAEGTIYDIDFAEFAPLGNEGFHCDGERNSVWGMSRDKRFTCGLMEQAQCSAIAYVRDETTGVRRNLGTLYFYKPSRANDVSLDGGTVCGWNDDYTGYRQGCVWRRDASGNYVPTLMNTGVATVKMREAGACSGNGQWAYGQGRPDVSGGAPYRWSAATGYQPIIPAPAGVGSVTDANFDGSTVLAYFGVTTFIWFADRGYVPIATWAAEHGVTLPPEWAFRGFAMTDDALTIVGHAIRTEDGLQSPFVLDLRPSTPGCPADLNDDGTVNGDDLGTLLGAWGDCSTTPCTGDINVDGTVNGDDLGLLLAAWGACPA